MKTNHNLEELFSLAKNQPPLFSKEETLHAIHVHKKSLLKSIFMKTIILSGIIASTYFGYQYLDTISKENTISKDSENVYNEISELHTEEYKIEKYKEKQTFEKKLVENYNSDILLKKTKKIPSKNISENTSELEGESTDNNEPIYFQEKLDLTPVIINKEVQESGSKDSITRKEECIVLSKEELSKLGIYVKDGNFMFDILKTKNYRINGHVLKDYSIFYSSSSKMGGYNLKNGSTPLFYAATTPNNEILFNLTGHLKNEIVLDLEDISQNMIPFWVEIGEGGIPAIIVWFGKDIIDKKFLPENLFDEIKENQKKYCYSKKFKTFLTSHPTKKEVFKVVIPHDQIIKPNEKLIKKLGFRITKNELKFKKRTLSGIIKYTEKEYTSSIVKRGSLNGFKSKNLSSILPSYRTTDSLLLENDIVSYKNLGLNDRLQMLLNDMPEMIALKIQSPYFKRGYHLFWYQYNEAIANELDPETRARIDAVMERNQKLKADNLNVNPEKAPKLSYGEIAESQELSKDLIKTLSLPPKQLQLLGIQVINKEIMFKFPNIKEGLYTQTKLFISKSGTIVDVKEIANKPDTAGFVYPMMVTDFFGKNMRLSFGNQKLGELSHLVPIKIISGNSYDAEDKIKNFHHPDLIFWYEPNEKFLQILEEQMATEIKHDAEIIQCKRNQQILDVEIQTECETMQVMSCKYYESCENNLEKNISAYKVYPNPTKGLLNIDLKLSIPTTLKYKIQTIDGKILHQENELLKGATEMHKKLDINLLSHGIYLLIIETFDGDKIVERFVVSE